MAESLIREIREMQARRLELEKAKAELSALRERVAIAEHVGLASQFVVGALSSSDAEVRVLPTNHR